MKNVKTTILLTSGGLVLGATTTALGAALFASDPSIIARTTMVATILGLGSIGLFFVGLAFPKEQVAQESSRALKD